MFIERLSSENLPRVGFSPLDPAQLDNEGLVLIVIDGFGLIIGAKEFMLSFYYISCKD